MRCKRSTLVAACAAALLAASPGLACPFSTQASSDSQGQQTAQAQPADAATPRTQ